MAIDRAIPTAPPANTTMAFFAAQVQEELTPIWQNVVLPLTVAGTANAISATAAPAITSYTDARIYVATFPSANTGPMTISIDGLAPLPLRDASGAALAAGAVSAGQSTLIFYNSGAGDFRVVGGGGGAALPTPTQQWQILQADAALNPQWSLQIFSGNF